MGGLSDMEKAWTSRHCPLKLLKLWKSVDCGRLCILIVEENLIKCENFFLYIEYLAYLLGPMNDESQNNSSYLWKF